MHDRNIDGYLFTCNLNVNKENCCKKKCWFMCTLFFIVYIILKFKYNKIDTALWALTNAYNWICIHSQDAAPLTKNTLVIPYHLWAVPLTPCLWKLLICFQSLQFCLFLNVIYVESYSLKPFEYDLFYLAKCIEIHVWFCMY